MSTTPSGQPWDPEWPDPGSWNVSAVAIVRSTRTEPVDDHWDTESTTITLLPQYPEIALLGIEEFSHVDIVYVFHAVDEHANPPLARHPRSNPDWPLVGVFAQRAKDRPNRLGLSTCELIAVQGSTLHVRGLDAIDGTPVIDIKPHLVEFSARGEVRQPLWADQLMRDYF